MANRFFYRFAALTLDGTLDHAFGSADTTATVNGSAALSTSSPIYGTHSGLYGAGGSDQHRFDSTTDLIDRLEGALAFTIMFSALPTGLQGVVSISGPSGNMVLQIGAGNLYVKTNLEQAGESQVVTAGAAISATATQYRCLYRWDHANSLRRIEVYNAAGTLLDEIENTDAWTAPPGLASTNGFRIGNLDGNDGAFKIDNVIIDDAYDAPLELNFAIAGYPDYDDGAGTVTVTAAGASGVLRVNQVGASIVGTGFGATQGGGYVRVCPSDDIDDVNGVNQTVTAWGDTGITINVVLSTLAVNTGLFLFVESDGGDSNAAGFAVQINPSIGALAFGAGLLT
jgi:hypothetical protein